MTVRAVRRNGCRLRGPHPGAEGRGGRAVQLRRPGARQRGQGADRQHRAGQRGLDPGAVRRRDRVRRLRLRALKPGRVPGPHGGRRPVPGRGRFGGAPGGVPQPRRQLAPAQPPAAGQPRRGGCAGMSVEGTDDTGLRPGSPVRLTVPAGGAIDLTSAELESGDAEAIESGALGDGGGKWRLRIESDRPVAALSLATSPTGRLVNLSGADADRGFRHGLLPPPGGVTLESPYECELLGRWDAAPGRPPRGGPAQGRGASTRTPRPSAGRTPPAAGRACAKGPTQSACAPSTPTATAGPGARSPTRSPSTDRSAGVPPSSPERGHPALDLPPVRIQDALAPGNARASCPRLDSCGSFRGQDALAPGQDALEPGERRGVRPRRRIAAFNPQRRIKRA